MNEIQTVFSLIDWKLTLTCIAIVAAVIAVFSTVFVRYLDPRVIQAMTKISAFIICGLVLVQALADPELPYMGSSVYAALAVTIVLIGVITYYLFDWIAYILWNFRADRINRRENQNQSE